MEGGERWGKGARGWGRGGGEGGRERGGEGRGRRWDEGAGGGGSGGWEEEDGVQLRQSKSTPVAAIVAPVAAARGDER